MSLQRYRLDDLGWQLFEALCQSILLNRFAVGVQAWGGTGDWGRDAFFEGVLPIPDGSRANRRQFVFQAKFVENANAAGARPTAALTKAINKEIKRLAHRDPPDCFVLMTNVSLSSDLRTTVETLLSAALPNAEIVTWGGAELCPLLDGLPEVRIAFPQLLSLRDFRALLDGLIHKATHARSATMIARATEEAQVFVPTRVYRDALNTLIEHGMAVLSGLPEMGKTTIAFSIALSRAVDGWRYFSVRSSEELLSLHEPNERQIFVADDAFGSTEYKPGLADEWASSLETILGKIDKNHWIIWTTRTGPLKEALQKMHLQGIAEKFPDPGSVLVKASELSVREKALMLYAHAKTAELAADKRSIVRAHAELIVKHEFFTPKRVQRFIRETLPALDASAPICDAIEHEIRTPTDSMRKSFDALPEPHRLFLVAALDGPTISKSFARHAPGTALSPQEAESKLLEHFIVRTETWRYARKEDGVSWAHPSWRDMVIECVAESPERRGAFLANCSVDGLALALSSGGGAGGDRRLPFLKTADDWEIVEQRLPKLVERLEESEVSDLLALIKDVTAPSFCSDEEQVRRLTKWSYALLQGLRDYWNRENSFIPPTHLAMFFELSTRTIPLLAGPDLRATWDETVNEALSQIAMPDYYTSFTSLREFWDACALIRENEPRFLRHVGFPDALVHVGERALDEFESYLDADHGLSDRQQYEEEVEQVECIAEHAASIGALFPSLVARANKLISSAEYSKHQLHERLEEGLPDRRPRHTPSIRPVSPPLYDDIDIDIAKLFSDL